MTGIYATAREMLSDLAAKKISARELLDMHVARNDALHAKLNIIVDTDLEHARAAAKSIDDARAHGAQLGALAGLPMTIKDGFDVFGMPAVVGAKGFVGRKKDCNDADVVAAARKAEAIIWGKSNVPYMLSDIQSYNVIYGTTNNPYDVTRVPGGSSGGAAAALASGITPLEIGSDIGGSLRHPANFCGVYSLKPTWGVLSLRGHIPPAPDQYVEGDLGVVGPMARNAEDLRLLWSVLNHSPIQKRRDVKGARIAIWDEESGWPLARNVKDAVKRAGDALAKQGAHVEHAKPDINGEAMMLSYRAILTAIVSLGFPQEMFETFVAMHDADRKLVAAGKDVDGAAANRLRATARFREVAAAQVVQQAMKDKLAAFFQEWDAVLMPISPVTAFKHMQDGDFNSRILDVDGKPAPYPSLLMWISLATFLHAPSIAVPAGRTSSGMPVGVQVVGPWRSEDRLFDYAAAIEDVLGGFEPPAL